MFAGVERQQDEALTTSTALLTAAASYTCATPSPNDALATWGLRCLAGLLKVPDRQSGSLLHGGIPNITAEADESASASQAACLCLREI